VSDATTAFETKELERPCAHCGRALVLFQGVPMHASAWDEVGQREIYRHCRVHVAEPAAKGEAPDDLVERESALGRYFDEAGMDWRKPDLVEAAGLVAFRAGWRAARA
jgi:hypothetical protein